MFEGDSADMCAGKFPLVLMGGWAEALACADLGARTPIGASRIITIILLMRVSQSHLTIITIILHNHYFVLIHPLKLLTVLLFIVQRVGFMWGKKHITPVHFSCSVVWKIKVERCYLICILKARLNVFYLFKMENLVNSPLRNELVGKGLCRGANLK